MQNQTLTMMMTFLFSFTFLANDTSTNMNPAFCTGEGEPHLHVVSWTVHLQNIVPQAYSAKSGTIIKFNNWSG